MNTRSLRQVLFGIRAGNSNLDSVACCVYNFYSGTSHTTGITEVTLIIKGNRIVGSSIV